MTTVKICGITRYEDGLAACQAGAAMLGFNFYRRSKRFVEPENCREITCGLSRLFPKVVMVGVFVNAGFEEITTTMEQARLHLAQLHGDESPGLLAKLGKRAFKAIRPKNAADLLQLQERYPPAETLPAFLVDACHPREFGGTGLVGDWSLAKSLAKKYAVLLAGGLTPGNAAEAVRQVCPWGVDVASGVEAQPGIKDPGKIQAFIKAVEKIDAEL
ncbi:MAG: phosphoribosylanthranilate isomerase [Anaerolineales bacterium]|nr:phosphoribosylanthranilate isomerase [Anaerolineales bacterium]